MNKTQRILICVGCALAGLNLFFMPAEVRILDEKKGTPMYVSIFTQPHPSVVVSYPALLLRLGAVAGLSAALVFAFKDRQVTP